MGSPELPHEDENNISRPPVNNLPMHGGNTGTSDDSDNENNEEAYAGYQPLAFDEDTMEYTTSGHDIDDTEHDADDDFDYQAFNAPTMAPETDVEVPTIDAEVESEVWNAPRPESSNIELDSAKTAQIMSAMAQISIPSTSIPVWAQGVSEDKWKEELLQRIRQRQNPADSKNSSSSK